MAHMRSASGDTSGDSLGAPVLGPPVIPCLDLAWLLRTLVQLASKNSESNVVAGLVGAALKAVNVSAQTVPKGSMEVTHSYVGSNLTNIDGFHW